MSDECVSNSACLYNKMLLLLLLLLHRTVRDFTRQKNKYLYFTYTKTELYFFINNEHVNWIYYKAMEVIRDEYFAIQSFNFEFFFTQELLYYPLRFQVSLTLKS